MSGSLKDFIDAVVYRDGKHLGGETLVVASHTQQMLQWIIRQGLRFYPKQDDPQGSRQKKIDEILDYNRLDLYLDGIVSLFLCRGSVLWYLRPTGAEPYEIYWYQGGDVNDPSTEYRAYYQPGGRFLQEVVIRYSYEDFSNPGMGQAIYANASGYTRWVRLSITANQIIEERHTTLPTLMPEAMKGQWTTGGGMDVSSGGYYSAPLSRKVVQNTLGFIPCVESPNLPMRPGDRGHGEFDWLRNAIEAEDAMRSAMLDNVFLMGNPSLVTTRPKQQVLEAMDDGGGGRNHWSSQKGYESYNLGSTRRMDPFNRDSRYTGAGSGNLSWGNRKQRIARIIGNVLPEERFGYIFPDPINGDQWRFTQEYREGIHEALGGIDPLGGRSGMTFGEIKSLHGKVAATASKKCKSLWDYGLTKLLEMVVFIEEQLFLSSYKNYLISDENKDAKSRKEYRYQLEEFGSISDDAVLDHLMNVNEMMVPPGVTGLVPYGDRTVCWKWKGGVFEDSPRDRLDLSIGVRNYQELGVGSLQSMEFLFPEKEPNEIKAMLSGVPFRFIQSVSSSIGTLLQLQQQMMQVPDPANPSVPLAARPELDLTPLMQQIRNSLEKEISYGAEFIPSTPISSPALGSSNPFGNSATFPTLNGGTTTSGLSASNSSGIGGTSPERNSVPSPYAGSGTNSFYAAGFTDPAFGISSDSLVNGGSQLPGSYSAYSGQSDWTSPIPQPGGTIVPSSSNPASGFGSPDAAVSTGIPGVPSDILLTPGLQSIYQPPVLPSTSPDSSQRNADRSGGSRRLGRKRRK